MTTLPQLRTPSRLLLTSTMCLLMSLLTTSSGFSQTMTCDAPNRCMSKARVNALVDAACLVHKERAGRLDAVTKDLARAQEQHQQCKGQLLELRRRPVVRLSPVWLRVSLDVAVPVLAGAGGFCVAAGCPREVSVGILVGAGLGIVARVVLELIDGR